MINSSAAYSFGGRHGEFIHTSHATPLDGRPPSGRLGEGRKRKYSTIRNEVTSMACQQWSPKGFHSCAWRTSRRTGQFDDRNCVQMAARVAPKCRHAVTQCKSRPRRAATVRRMPRCAPVRTCKVLEKHCNSRTVVRLWSARCVAGYANPCSFKNVTHFKIFQIDQ